MIFRIIVTNNIHVFPMFMGDRCLGGLITLPLIIGQFSVLFKRESAEFLQCSRSSVVKVWMVGGLAFHSQ